MGASGRTNVYACLPGLAEEPDRGGVGTFSRPRTPRRGCPVRSDLSPSWHPGSRTAHLAGSSQPGAVKIALRRDGGRSLLTGEPLLGCPPSLGAAMLVVLGRFSLVPSGGMYARTSGRACAPTAGGKGPRDKAPADVVTAMRRAVEQGHGQGARRQCPHLPRIGLPTRVQTVRRVPRPRQSVLRQHRRCC
jgi:hypothetical protein